MFHNQLVILETILINMNTAIINPPLSNLQIEMLKLFAYEIPEENLSEVKNLIAKYLLEQARDKADAAWVLKGYTSESFEKLLNE